MTPEAQRIAIANHCGTPDAKWWCPRCQMVVPPHAVTYEEHHEGCGTEMETTDGPDYLNDLNACHEMENHLTSEQQEEYDYQLSEICAPITGESWMKIHATAAQRGEAFLKTIGKWKDEA